MRSAFVQLIALDLALVRARWRRATRRVRGIEGVAGGMLASLFSGALLLGGAVFFMWVSVTLMTLLPERGQYDLAAHTGGLMTDAASVLAILAVLMADPSKGETLRVPLTVLPIRPFDRLAADLVSLLFLEPVALVIWPTSLALVIGPGQVRADAGLLMVPAAAGSAMVAASAALFVRRLSARHGGPAGGVKLSGMWGRVLLVSLPVLWLLTQGGSLESLTEDGPLLGTPGYFVSLALDAAWRGDGAAVVVGLGLLMLAFGLLCLAGIAAANGPGADTDRRAFSRWRRIGPLEFRRLLLTERARILLGQSFASGLLIMILTIVLSRRGVFGGETLLHAGAFFSAWMLAQSTAPLMSNALGLGGRASAGMAMLPVRGVVYLLEIEFFLASPAIVGVAILALLMAYLDGFAFSLTLVVFGLGVCLAGAGIGAWLSTFWPWPAPGRVESSPLWPPGPSRLLMPIGQGLPTIPLAGWWRGFCSWPTALSACLMIGLLVAVLGIAVAGRRLDRRRKFIAEALLS